MDERDTPQGTCSDHSDSYLPLSRRDAIIGGTSTLGVLATGGTAGATSDSDSSDTDTSSKICNLTINVTGLELDGPLSDATVSCGPKEFTTDEEGSVQFELDAGTYEITIEKDGWGKRTRQIELKKNQDCHIPMYCSQFYDLEIIVCDASHGGPIEGATVRVSGYGTVTTDSNGTALIPIDKLLEATEHELTVTADGGHSETRRITINEDTQHRIELVLN